MTKADMQAAVHVAQVTYVLEGGDKDHMVTLIPEAWGHEFLGELLCVPEEGRTAPVCISRNQFFDSIRQEMEALRKAAQSDLNRQLSEDGNLAVALWSRNHDR